MSAELVPVSVPGTNRTIMASLVDGKHAGDLTDHVIVPRDRGDE